MCVFFERDRLCHVLTYSDSSDIRTGFFNIQIRIRIQTKKYGLSESESESELSESKSELKIGYGFGFRITDLMLTLSRNYFFQFISKGS